jgi:hypothetical protein
MLPIGNPDIGNTYDYVNMISSCYQKIIMNLHDREGSDAVGLLKGRKKRRVKRPDLSGIQVW